MILKLNKYQIRLVKIRIIIHKSMEQTKRKEIGKRVKWMIKISWITLLRTYRVTQKTLAQLKMKQRVIRIVLESPLYQNNNIKLYNKRSKASILIINIKMELKLLLRILMKKLKYHLHTNKRIIITTIIILIRNINHK